MKLKFILAELIKSRGTNLSQVSRETGVPKQTLHNWICGAEPKKLGSVLKIARYFGLSIESLCYGEDKITDNDLTRALSKEIDEEKFEAVFKKN